MKTAIQSNEKEQQNENHNHKGFTHTHTNINIHITWDFDPSIISRLWRWSSSSSSWENAAHPWRRHFFFFFFPFDYYFIPFHLFLCQNEKKTHSCHHKHWTSLSSSLYIKSTLKSMNFFSYMNQNLPKAESEYLEKKKKGKNCVCVCVCVRHSLIIFFLSILIAIFLKKWKKNFEIIMLHISICVWQLCVRKKNELNWK